MADLLPVVTPPKVIAGLSFKTLAVLTLAVVALFIFAIEYIRPGIDNSGIDAQIITLAGVVLALLKTQETHLVVNSRMTEMLAISKQAEFAKGAELATATAVQKAVGVAADVAAERLSAALDTASRGTTTNPIDADSIKVVAPISIEVVAPPPTEPQPTKRFDPPSKRN